MSEERVCRRCLLLKSGREDILKDIKMRIEKIPEKDKTNSDEYHQRLTLCGGCEFLSEGTCLKCGCYPEFRAAYIRNRCPIKKW